MARQMSLSVRRSWKCDLKLYEGGGATGWRNQEGYDDNLRSKIGALLVLPALKYTENI